MSSISSSHSSGRDTNEGGVDVNAYSKTLRLIDTIRAEMKKQLSDSDLSRGTSIGGTSSLHSVRSCATKVTFADEPTEPEPEPDPEQAPAQEQAPPHSYPSMIKRPSGKAQAGSLQREDMMKDPVIQEWLALMQAKIRGNSSTSVNNGETPHPLKAQQQQPARNNHHIGHYDYPYTDPQQPRNSLNSHHSHHTHQSFDPRELQPTSYHSYTSGLTHSFNTSQHLSHSFHSHGTRKSYSNYSAAQQQHHQQQYQGVPTLPANLDLDAFPTEEDVNNQMWLMRYRQMQTLVKTFMMDSNNNNNNNPNNNPELTQEQAKKQAAEERNKKLAILLGVLLIGVILCAIIFGAVSANQSDTTGMEDNQATAPPMVMRTTTTTAAPTAAVPTPSPTFISVEAYIESKEVGVPVRPP